MTREELQKLTKIRAELSAGKVAVALERLDEFLRYAEFALDKEDEKSATHQEPQ